MEYENKKLDNNKNGCVNDQPLFMQNGSRRFSASVDTEEIGNFRRALPQFLAVSAKNILLFVYGMTLGFPTIVIPAIQGGEGREPSDIVLNRDEISWFSSINLICVPLGCLFSGLLTQPIGKRKAMQIVNLPILASWLLFHFSTRTEHLYAALCLSGLGGGLMEAPVLTYVAEITEPKYRGILSALGSTCVITGVFIQFIMGSLMDWRTIAAISAAFPVISIIALFFVPESPTWLIREGRYREAIKALQWLRGWVHESKIETEFNRLYDELITQPALEEAAENCDTTVKSTRFSRFRKMFRKRSFLAPFFLVTFTFFCGHFSGKTTLQTYAVQIFHTLKAPINKYHATILLGVAELIATGMCVFLIHFTGKRPLVLISTLGVGICFFGTATYAYYLKVVPGFAVSNVVANASLLIPNENIINHDNITKLFENEEKALMQVGSLGYNPEDMHMLNETTTPWDTLEDETTTTRNIVKRQVNDSLDISQLDYEDPKVNISDLFDLDLVDSEENQSNGAKVLNISDLFDLNQAEETTLKEDILSLDETVQDVTTVIPEMITKPPPSLMEVIKEKIPTTKDVVNDILLPVPKQEKNNLVWLPLILLLGAAFFAHFGIRMIPWILIGEVFPASIRSTSAGLASGLGYIFGFLANKVFLQMLSTLTMPGTFWFYSAVAFMGTIVIYFALPETEGRTLAEIEAHFSKKSTTNLLRKSKSDKEEPMFTKDIALSNLNNLHVPISPQVETKIIHLQQSDFGQPMQGHTNRAYEESNTTHL